MDVLHPLIKIAHLFQVNDGGEFRGQEGRFQNILGRLEIHDAVVDALKLRKNFAIRYHESFKGL